jgi:hypothetical protein
LAFFFATFIAVWLVFVVILPTYTFPPFITSTLAVMSGAAGVLAVIVVIVIAMSTLFACPCHIGLL